ncbi:hypothetical protein IMSAGC019_01900 [Lachnospiraceae bacterium]|nr:hypothetical protein IMSAGC019_01900 [Lachnospiraceae bacterium]
MSLKFGPISKKMEKVEITGQCVPGDGCDADCVREYWEGDSKSTTDGCSKKHHTDSHWSKCH